MASEPEPQMPPGLYAVGVEMDRGWIVVAWTLWRPWAEEIAAYFATARGTTADIWRDGTKVAVVAPSGEVASHV